MKKTSLFLVLLAIAAVLLSSCARAPRPSSEIVEELVVYYGTYGAEADEKVDGLLRELSVADPAAGETWKSIMSLWRSVSSPLPLNYGVLPDGLPDTDELCIVVLGFQLEPDGSMRPELIERLKVALACAEQYPRALIVCTGGGTASENPSATEAGRMAEYLIANGIAPERIIVEDRSQTTAQNAAFSCAILASQYPQVHKLAILSSDYHIATGVLLFGAQSILAAAEPGQERFEVVSNAAYPAPSGSLSSMFQAGALIELSGDIETAFAIYYDTYDIHELPPLNGEG